MRTKYNTINVWQTTNRQYIENCTHRGRSLTQNPEYLVVKKQMLPLVTASSNNYDTIKKRTSPPFTKLTVIITNNSNTHTYLQTHITDTSYF